jgi:hypothetical protein
MVDVSTGFSPLKSASASKHGYHLVHKPKDSKPKTAKYTVKITRHVLLPFKVKQVERAVAKWYMTITAFCGCLSLQ